MALDPLHVIQPGDILEYDRKGFFNSLIKVKRGEQYSHVEIALSQAETVASRNGIGVGRYPLNLDGLAAIYRSTKPLDIQAGLEWFQKVNGQGYDWVGLLAFSWAQFRGRTSLKMFCSEFATRFIRHCGVLLFGLQVDADTISPEMMTYSEDVTPVWLRSDKKLPHEN